MKWLRAVLISLLISLLVGLAIGTWIRLQLEAPVRYIGQLAPRAEEDALASSCVPRLRLGTLHADLNSDTQSA